VPSSFSSTMWSSKTLSYRVCGGFTAEGMMDVEVVVAQEIEFVGAKAREKYQLNQEVGSTRRGRHSA
jgi:hypothetical protein